MSDFQFTDKTTVLYTFVNDFNFLSNLLFLFFFSLRKFSDGEEQDNAILIPKIRNDLRERIIIKKWWNEEKKLKLYNRI